MSDINITYETLYEILRNEKNRDDIQELPITFYEDVIEYLKRNKKMLDDAIITNAPEDEKEDITRQIKNIKVIIKEIYERREKKIINLAINRSRTGSEGLESGSLLVSEKEFYTRTFEMLDCFRGNILARALAGKVPVANEGTCAIVEHQKDSENIINNTESDSIERQTAEGAIHARENEEAQAASTVQPETEPSQKTLKFKETVPKFLGKELEVYGPFEPEDVATLPYELANILIRKGKAEEIVQG